MNMFTSHREKRLWIWVFAVIAAIFMTIFLGQPLANIISNKNLQGITFGIAMIMIGGTIFTYGFRSRPSRTEWVTVIGLTSVYIMLFLRLALPERTHLMEYSVLAIFIHNAFSERVRNGKKIPGMALLTIVLASLIGVLDESIQYLIPGRVFDLQDIAFNIFAAVLAVSASRTFHWIKTREW